MKPINRKSWHKPVLLKQAIDFLNISKGRNYIDATLGGGGFSQEILKRGGRVLSIEQDPEIISLAKKHYSYCPSASWQIIKGNFAKIKEICQKKKFSPVAGVVFDLGISSLHYFHLKKGFSFRENSFLDMRLDPTQKTTAADIVNNLPQKELEENLLNLVQEKLAKNIAREIVKKRQSKPIENTKQLTEIIESVYQKEKIFSKQHPATKTFLALRILTNQEFDNLKRGLIESLEILIPGGRLVVISFHSGEDRIVKSFFKDQEKKNRLKILTKKPILPSFLEIKSNPLSRSARLRAGEKL